MMKLPLAPAWTVPLTPIELTALSTCAWVSGLPSWRLNSVPPAKSMPSRKPRVTMKKMPGRMISRDSPKNQLRRPTMSSRRGGRTLTAVSAVSSVTAPVGRLSSASATADAQHALAPGPARDQHDGEEVVGHDDAADLRDRDTDRQGEREALDRAAGADHVQ